MIERPIRSAGMVELPLTDLGLPATARTTGLLPGAERLRYRVGLRAPAAPTE